MDSGRATKLRSKVREVYSAAAETPCAEHPFPVGRQFAESLGYPRNLLDHLPAISADAFAGLSSIVLSADLSPGSTVLDLGCGAGLDSLIAARRVGSGGRVIGVDFSDSMLRRAAMAAREYGSLRLLFCRGDAENLPLQDHSADAALVNGIFNLNPAREAIFSELARVVRPGGTVYAAEIILRQPLSSEESNSDANWFA